MKIPQYILHKMKVRRDAAIKLMCLDSEVKEWLESRTHVPSFDVLSSCYDFNSILSLTEPEIYMQRQIEDIEKYEN